MVSVLSSLCTAVNSYSSETNHKESCPNKYNFGKINQTGHMFTCFEAKALSSGSYKRQQVNLGITMRRIEY
jgi:hypothetical protein